MPLELFDGQLPGEEKAAGGTGVAWNEAQFRRFFREKEGGQNP
jgi:hypothetical protein